MLLVADSTHGKQAGGSQPREFPLHRTNPGLRVANDLIGIKASLRIAEQQSDHPALGLGEQCLR